MSITKHIPNSITCCNLISGCIAVTYAFMLDFHMALLWIIIGAVFDFFDGMSARLLHVSSPIGKELDSLADVVTFGVAPATMLFTELSVMTYPTLMEPLRAYVPYIAFLMAAFSALRLAKFNLDERQRMGFIGLPTPANALFWGGLIVGGSQFLESKAWTSWMLIGLLLLSCWLLVAEIPMFALKFKHWRWEGNKVRYLFVLTCIPLLLIFGIAAFAIIVAWYVVLSIVVNHSSSPQ